MSIERKASPIRRLLDQKWKLLLVFAKVAKCNKYM